MPAFSCSYLQPAPSPGHKRPPAVLMNSSVYVCNNLDGPSVLEAESLPSNWRTVPKRRKGSIFQVSEVSGEGLRDVHRSSRLASESCRCYRDEKGRTWGVRGPRLLPGGPGPLCGAPHQGCSPRAGWPCGCAGRITASGIVSRLRPQQLSGLSSLEGEPGGSDSHLAACVPHLVISRRSKPITTVRLCS